MNQQVENKQQQQQTIDTVLSLNHSNWLKQDLTAYHLKKLEELEMFYLREASRTSVNFNVDENRQEVILSKLVRAKTISDIIQYVKTNQYPS